MIIGLLGLDFGSKNLGCAALAYSFLILIDRCAKDLSKEIKVKVFTCEPNEIDLSHYSNMISVEVIEFHYRNIGEMRRLRKNISECDDVYDFTSGDSFSDIYGFPRFFKTSFVKAMVIMSKSRLHLGPQTYGPFYSKFNERIARWLIQHSDSVYARDHLSAEYAGKLTKKHIPTAIDVAFALPFTQSQDVHTSAKIKVGINVSALLWHGGYNQNNQFNLKTDYRQYCISIVKWLHQQNLEVHLIPHVLSDDLYVENDYIACNELNEQCDGKCVVAPAFKTPVEAKIYIADVNFFIGARMHSTIAALSAGCCVVPFAYSRKFQGLFNSLGYSHVLDGTKLNTDEAILYTKNIFNAKANIKRDVDKAKAKAEETLAVFQNELLKGLHK